MSSTTRVKIGLIAGILGFVALSLILPWQRGDERARVEMVGRLQGQWVGRDAPTFTLPDLGGQTHDLAEYRGKVVFLNFWASFCEPCRREMPSMERLVRDYDDRGLVMLAVSFDQQASDADGFMQEFLPGQRSAMTVLHDPTSTVGQSFGTELLPETYIIDRQGIIVARFVNEYDWTRPEVRTLIEDLLSGSGASSRPLL
ncbi:MAG: TlpA disulfide reductase family protein [Myxococcota bacterium]